jgi:hypothetical protein
MIKTDEAQKAIIQAAATLMSGPMRYDTETALGLAAELVRKSDVLARSAQAWCPKCEVHLWGATMYGMIGRPCETDGCDGVIEEDI